ncbi:MAG: PIN domain-containing protein [Candidatus Accumulibacter sp.]|nr:PIN domain-containing protein [Accumulibacter sp.]MCM8620303.1 PIN domain-containing protein [Accumulibacter sp.]
MLAKITSKNQLTLPKSITAAVGPAEYFEVEARNGQIVLTPVRIQRADAVRAKLAELNLDEQDVADYLPYCITVCIPDPAPEVPACRDIFDLSFLQQAVAGRADALVTGDQELLSLSDSFVCPIVTAEQ